MTTHSRVELDQQLDNRLRRAARRRHPLPPPQVHVLSESLGVEYRFGAQRRFHSASVSKVMTATLILQLVTEGHFQPSTPITTLVPTDDWAGLFVVDGADLAGEVTVEHLLSHTGGAADYFEGPTAAARSFTDEIAHRPDRYWEPSAVLDYSRRFQRPVGRPGERFHYSDNGYVLLGRIIEEVTGGSLGATLHERVFGPAGMADSSASTPGSLSCWPGLTTRAQAAKGTLIRSLNRDGRPDELDSCRPGPVNPGGDVPRLISTWSAAGGLPLGSSGRRHRQRRTDSCPVHTFPAGAAPSRSMSHRGQDGW